MFIININIMSSTQYNNKGYRVRRYDKHYGKPVRSPLFTFNRSSDTFTMHDGEKRRGYKVENNPLPVELFIARDHYNNWSVYEKETGTIVSRVSGKTRNKALYQLEEQLTGRLRHHHNKDFQALQDEFIHAVECWNTNQSN